MQQLAFLPERYASNIIENCVAHNKNKMEKRAPYAPACFIQNLKPE